MAEPTREISQRLLADLLALSTQQIRNLEKLGLPHRSAGRKKLYPVPDAVLWYLRRKQEEAGVNARPSTYDAARARAEVARARMAEIEVAREEKLIYTAELVDRRVGETYDLVATRIKNMPGRWGAQLVGLESPREGEALLRRIANELLEELSGPAADQVDALATPAPKRKGKRGRRKKRAHDDAA